MCRLASPRRIRRIRRRQVPETRHRLPVRAQEADQRADNSRRAALEAPRRTDARQLPHEQPQVEAPDVDEEPLQDVGMTAQMCPPQVPRLKQMDI